MLDFKGKPPGFIKSKLKINNILVLDSDDGYICFPPNREQEAQEIIDQAMPDLDPVQFNFMLNRYGFRPIISALLENIREEDIEKYSLYDAFLRRASKYEFYLTIKMLNDVKDKYDNIPELNLSIDQLTRMWLSVINV